MNIIFQISKSEAAKMRHFYEEMSSNGFVRGRSKGNVTNSPSKVTKAEFWRALITALLTSQQRSGPDSPVYRFITARPFPLTLRNCMAQNNMKRFVKLAIAQFGGIRFGTKIAEHLDCNLHWLNGIGWMKTFEAIAAIKTRNRRKSERDAANFLAGNLVGIGPKQSRNLLQSLGVTQYEIPIDSRITKWLNRFGFPLHLTSTGLSDRAYYEFVNDGFIAMCDKAGVLPCLMDAAIFASFDGDKWNEVESVRW